jgi:hypothetical protein
MNNEFESNGAASDGEVLGFLSSLNANCRAAWVANGNAATTGTAEWFDANEAFGAEVGPKYIRIVKHRAPRAGDAPYEKARKVTTAAGVSPRVVTSAFCFIDRATGNILKAASFSAPAKGVRGNIRDPHYWLKSVTPYGAAYLR